MGLCVTRKPGEKVMIGDHVVVTVVRFEKGRVMLDIDAPPDVMVDREELRAEKLASAALAVPSKPCPIFYGHAKGKQP